jgi:penicillin V acylase-like amidase (Ntn superfamily)
MDMPLPGNVNAVDHFQRAAVLPEPVVVRQAAAGLMAEFGVYNTEYRTVVDLTNRLDFFELSVSPDMIWVEVDDLKLGDDTQPLEINPYDSTLVRDMTSRFQSQRVPFQSREYAVN